MKDAGFDLLLCLPNPIPRNPARAVYRTVPPEVTNELAYIPDQMILDFLFIKVRLNT